MNGLIMITGYRKDAMLNLSEIDVSRWPHWLSDDGNVLLVNSDCLEVLPVLPKVDLVLTDPPYGIGIAANPVRQKHEKLSWDSCAPSKPVIELCVAAGGSAILWGGNYFELPPSQGFFVWDKQQPQDFSLAMVEQAWTNIKTPAKLFRQSVTSYDKVHPTQKPDRLMEWCIGFANNATTILDPFTGSGTTGVACVRLGRQFIGIEKEPKYYEIAIKRIKAEQERFPLFEQPTKQEAKTLPGFE